jgi:site-specific recombinase XerD
MNESRLEKNGQSDWFFPSHRKDGHPFRGTKIAFKRAIQLSAIAPVRFHDLRHTFATRLVRAEVDLITVKQLLCHAKNTMNDVLCSFVG